MASQLYIATRNAPLSDRFQEMLDMLMTGAAFGLPTTLWLTDGCLEILAAQPANDTLMQLKDFGVRCVASQSAHGGSVQLERLDDQTLQGLRHDCQQALVF